MVEIHLILAAVMVEAPGVAIGEDTVEITAEDITKPNIAANE